MSYLILSNHSTYKSKITYVCTFLNIQVSPAGLCQSICKFSYLYSQIHILISYMPSDFHIFGFLLQSWQFLVSSLIYYYSQIKRNSFIYIFTLSFCLSFSACSFFFLPVGLLWTVILDIFLFSYSIGFLYIVERVKTCGFTS